MSSPDELDRLGGELFRKSRTADFRERMRSFVEATEPVDFERVRETAAVETPMSELIDEGRDERL